jgi:sugar O-acyltransferase (sialic acid O-acetyltransferase NeuD family)
MRQLLGQVDDCIEFGGFVVQSGNRDGNIPESLVAGDDEWLAECGRKSDPPAVVLGSGFPGLRSKMLDSARLAQLRVLSLVHPSAVVDLSEVVIGEGGVICAGVVTTCNISIGDGALVNWNVTVGHDTRIGRCSVINPGAHVSGSVDIGDRVLVGAGAVVLQGVSIGDGAVIGAGAVVTKDVTPDATVVGVPARRLDL